jgi:Putative beta-barrel porin 2
MMRQPLVCLSLALLCAAAASAEEGAERRFTWRPSFETRSVYDDNAFLAESGEDADVGVWIVPRLELDYRLPAVQLGADLGGEIPRYFDHSSLNDAFWRMQGHGEVGLWPGLSLRVSDAYVPQPAQLGRPDDAPTNMVQSNRADAELRYWRDLWNGHELTLGIGGGRFDSNEFTAVVPGPGNSLVVDENFEAKFTEGRGYGELRNPIGENLAILLRTNIDYRKFDDESDADHLEAGGLLGLESQLPLGFDLDLAGGAGYLDTEGGSNQPHVVGYGNLVWRNAPSGLQVRLGFHHEMTQDLAGNDFMDTTGRVSIEKYFGLQTSATVTGFVSQFDNDSVNPSDNLYGGAEVVLRRQISRNFQVSLAYRYWDNAGDFDLDDFQQNQASLAITYRH